MYTVALRFSRHRRRERTISDHHPNVASRANPIGARAHLHELILLALKVLPDLSGVGLFQQVGTQWRMTNSWTPAEGSHHHRVPSGAPGCVLDATRSIPESLSAPALHAWIDGYIDGPVETRIPIVGADHPHLLVVFLGPSRLHSSFHSPLGQSVSRSMVSHLRQLEHPPAAPETAPGTPIHPTFTKLAHREAELAGLRTVNRFVTQLLRAQTEGEVLHQIRRVIPTLLPTPRSSLVLLGQDGRTMIGQALQGKDTAPRTFTVGPHTNVMECIRTGQVQLISNTAQSDRPDATWAHRNGWGSLMSAPVAGSTGTLGTLNFSRKAASGFSDIDRNLASSLASGIGHALEAVRRQVRTNAARAAAEAQERLKDQFLAVVAHELRTPLHAVVGMSELLTTEGRNDAQHELIEGIHAAGVLLSSLLDNILDYSKLEMGKLKIRTETVDLETLTREIISVLRPRAAARGLQLAYQFELKNPIIETDPGRLRQVLVNLINNAIKFTERGEVRLALTSPDDRSLFIAVSDTGVGIPAELHETIFQPFEQVDGSTTRVAEGTGLGLAICRQLCTALGGWIRVDSEAGAGSTFSMTIDGILRPRPVPVGPQDHAISKLRILVVDDNPVNRNVLCTMLSHLGQACDLADGGPTARGLYTSQAYDLVFVDLHMPGEDGITLTRALRNRPGPSAVFVTLTADAHEDTRERCLATGMSEVLLKPMRLPSLRRAIASVRPRTADQSAQWIGS